MSSARMQVSMVVATMALFLLILGINECLFTRLEFARGINWIYLPAGVRLLCTMLFAEAGAVGLLLVSWLYCFFILFPDDMIRSLVGGVLSTVAPYGAWRIARHVFGLESSLRNLSPRRLLWCIVGYAVASPLLHHLWFWMSGQQSHLLDGFFVMVAGDLSGSLIVVYTIKGALSLFPARPRPV